MKSLKGWNRFTPLRARITADLLKAESDVRFAALAKRVLVVETAIRVMNHKNGAFLDRPLPTLRSVPEMRELQSRMLNQKPGKSN